VVNPRLLLLLLLPLMTMVMGSCVHVGRGNPADGRVRNNSVFLAAIARTLTLAAIAMPGRRHPPSADVSTLATAAYIAYLLPNNDG